MPNPSDNSLPSHPDEASTRSFDSVSVAIIGAGISGLIAARILKDHGLSVVVFEKSRGVGGRMATRRTDGGLTFDHGAQYFTARDPRFILHVNSWIEKGVVANWPDQKLGDDQKIVVIEKGQIKSESKSDKRYVATPTMNAICKNLAFEVDVRKHTRVAVASPAEGKNTELEVELFDEDQNSLGKFDRLIVSTPAAQAAEILMGFPKLADQISQVKMNPCWATMVAFEEAITDQWAGAFIHESFLTWTARNSTKPGRSSAEQIIIHASPDWTTEHWEHDPEQVAQAMLAEFWNATGITPQPPTHLKSHRWKYAIPIDPSNAGCFANDSGRIVACGDWASGSRVEGAFLSGMAAAERIIETLSTSD